MNKNDFPYSAKMTMSSRPQGMEVESLTRYVWRKVINVTKKDQKVLGLQMCSHVFFESN